MTNEPGTTPVRRLDDELAALPRDLVPGRDLWAGIEAAISAEPVRRQMPRRWPLALAAGVAVAGLGALLALRVGHAPEAGPAGPTVASAEGPGARMQSKEDEFQATRVSLERTYRERLDLLPPKTRARVEADLALIRQAQQDIRDALARDPSSAVLGQLLQSTTEQEFDVYTTVDRATEPVLPRTRT